MRSWHDETGGQFSELAGPVQDYFIMVPLLGKIPGKSGKYPGNKQDGTGLLTTTRESLECCQILRLFWENLYKRNHSGHFLVDTINITNFSTNLVPLPKLFIKIKCFHSGSIWEFPNVSRPKTRLGSNQHQMTGLSRDREEDVPECSGPEIPRIFSGKIRFPGNAIWEPDL